MKKFLKRAGFGVLGVLVLLLLISFLLPSVHSVERSVKIDAPMHMVFEQVNDLRNWEKWSPWKKMDPLLEMTYSNPPAGQGAFYNWRSEKKNLGNGKLTLAEVVPNKKIVTNIEFEDWDTAVSTLKFTEEKGDILVSWAMDIDVGANPIGKYMGMMMKGQLKKQFDTGLEGIREICEG